MDSGGYVAWGVDMVRMDGRKGCVLVCSCEFGLIRLFPSLFAAIPHSPQVTLLIILVCPPNEIPLDACQFFLRRRQHADLRALDDHAHRIHAAPRLLRHRH